MSLIRAEDSPIPGLYNFTLEYGVDSFSRITYLKIFSGGAFLQPIIAPAKESYLTRRYDFAGPILGVISGAGSAEFYSESNYIARPVIMGVKETELSDLALAQMRWPVEDCLNFAKSVMNVFLSDPQIQGSIKDLTDQLGSAEEAWSQLSGCFSVMDFWESFGANKKSDLRARFKVLPRYAAEDMIWDMIKPGSPAHIQNTPTEELRRTTPLYRLSLGNFANAFIVSNMMNLFNEANVEAMREQGLTDPYEWEEAKSLAFQKMDIDENLSKAMFDILAPKGASIFNEQEAIRKSFEKRISLLPKMDDKALQLQRDLGLSGFLYHENYDELNMLLAFYEGLSSNYKEAIKTV